MLQESSNTAFIIPIILSEFHVILQISTMVPTKLKQKSMKMRNVLIGLLTFFMYAADRAYPGSAASAWLEVALAVIPFYSLKWLLSANYCSHHDFPDLYFSRLFLPSQFNY